MDQKAQDELADKLGVPVNHMGSARWLVKTMDPKPADKVLDFGCGNSRLAVALDPYLCSYVGVDADAARIRTNIDVWAEQDGVGRNAVYFHCIDFRNAMYNPDGRIDPETASIPFEDNWFDRIYAVSVFTHTETEAAASNLLRNLARCLKPGGRMFTTWFCSPPNVVCLEASRSAYREEFILDLLRECGLRQSRKMAYGYSTEHHDQRMIWSVKE